MPSTSRAIRYANEVDWRNPLPAYERIAAARLQNLKRLSDSPGGMKALLAYYVDGHWAEFICDWGWTFDPREQDVRLKFRPFILTPRQIEYVDWVYGLYRSQRTGVCRKHRDAGMSWINGAIGCLLWLAVPNTVIPYGSQKEEKVDAGPGNPDSIFWKLRTFIEKLPLPMQPSGWKKASKTFQIVNPTNGSVLLGEIGDSIGRGGRSTMAIPDEFGELQHPILVESSLSANTNCIIYGGTIPTSGWKGSHFWQLEQQHPDDRVFVFEWWQDPRKRQNPELPAEKEPWYVETKATKSPIVFKTQYLMQDDASSAVQFLASQPILDAFGRDPSQLIIHPKLPWRMSVDAAGMGNDKIKIRCRRGLLNKPVITLQHLDGIQLARVIQDIAAKLLATGPLELIAIERDGPGGSAADQLKYTSLASIIAAVHTGARVGDGRHYNLRAWLHQQAKDYLENEQPCIPYDREFMVQATSIHYSYKGGLLLIESKDEYRARAATGHSKAEKLASGSPDNWDSFMLGFVPPRGRPLTSLAPKFKALRVNHQKNAYALA
jgi:phage terminase large subunit